MAKNNDKKQTKELKADIIIAAYQTVKKANLASIETLTDRLRVVDAVRVMKPVAAAFEDAMETARELLKPEGYDAAVEKARKAESDGNPNPADVAKANAMSREYLAAMQSDERKHLEAVHTIGLESLPKPVLDKLIEGNAAWTPEQIMTIVDVLG